MSSRSKNNDQRGERPTLPPIRDLFQDPRAPHDSPSLTLARLRVSDDYDNDNSSAHSFPSRTFGNQSPDHHRRPFPAQYHHYPHRTPDVSSHHPARENRGPPSLLPSNRSLIGPALHPDQHGRYEYHTGYNVPYYAPQGWSSQAPLRRNTVSSSFEQRMEGDDSSRGGYSRGTIQHRHDQFKTHPARPQEIFTAVNAGRHIDDEQTPVARYGGSGHRNLPHLTQKASEEKLGGSTISKYECSYCGKGFNRPSSLKIHLNSHTGEKPFVCPVESCGRSFSVLSNMRRHARVHAQPPAKPSDPSSDDDSEDSSHLASSHDPLPSSVASSSQSHSRHADMSASRWQQRRDSSASTSSSTSSRRSRSYSPEVPNDSARPEKRLRGRLN